MFGAATVGTREDAPPARCHTPARVKGVTAPGNTSYGSEPVEHAGLYPGFTA